LQGKNGSLYAYPVVSCSGRRDIERWLCGTFQNKILHRDGKGWLERFPIAILRTFLNYLQTMMGVWWWIRHFAAEVSF